MSTLPGAGESPSPIVPLSRPTLHGQLVDDPHRDPAARQFGRRHQPDWTSPDHEHRIGHRLAPASVS